MKRRAKELFKALDAAKAALNKYQDRCKHVNSQRLPKSPLFYCDDCGKKWHEECKHEHVTRVAKSNTGNYDPSADCYWYICTCEDCGHRWTEDQ